MPKNNNGINDEYNYNYYIKTNENIIIYKNEIFFKYNKIIFEIYNKKIRLNFVLIMEIIHYFRK